MSITDYTILKFRRRSALCALGLLLSAVCIPSQATPSTMGGESLQGMSNDFEYVMRINRSAIALVDSNVVVSLNLTAIQDVPAMQSIVLVPVLEDTLTGRGMELPMIFINSRNQQIQYDRFLHEDYPDAIALRKKKGVDLDIDYLRTVKHERWMDNAVLKLRKQSCACNNPKDRGEMLVATFEKKEMPHITLYPVYMLPPADNSVKVREERGSAFLCFVVNKWDIKPDYMSNPAELMKIHNSVNLVKNDSDVTIRKMTIEGFASPEGPESRNQMLSNNRTEALKQYLLATNIAKGIHIEASGKGENWTGFKQYLKEHTGLPQYSKLLSIVNSSLSADEKERQMRSTAPEGYAYVLKNVFPALRCTNYTVVYTVRPFTLEESERVFETRPINLNLNEIYRLADKYASDKEKYYSIIRKAYMLYPNDPYINMTMACLAIKDGQADEAAGYLSKVDDCAERTMNEGLVAYLRGDFKEAVRLVKLAQQKGVSQAAIQLEEFSKLTKK